jgi:cold shock CspA family protein
MKGYGFIQPDDGGSDAFVHITAVERSGMGTLRENQRIPPAAFQKPGRGDEMTARPERGDLFVTGPETRHILPFAELGAASLA